MQNGTDQRSGPPGMAEFELPATLAATKFRENESVADGLSMMARAIAISAESVFAFSGSTEERRALASLKERFASQNLPVCI